MKGLFVEVASTPPPYLAEYARHLESHDPHLTETVLTSVRDWDWSQIDQVAFKTKLYVGAETYPWYGPRADTPPVQPWMVNVAGVAGMLTPSYRWDQINLDLATFRLAAFRGHHFYVAQEVGIDALGDHPNVRLVWEWYLIELCRQAYGLKPDCQIVWSPYAWDTWTSVSLTRRANIAAAMRTLISNVRTYSQTPGVTVIDLQDGRGAQPQEPASDAVNWWHLIKDCGATVRINAEWFTQDLKPQPREVMAARLNSYQAAGIPVGCCWEARYWYFPGWTVNH